MSSGSYLSSPLSAARPNSRPSSRNSIRSGRSSSPIVTLQDETVALRTQMSTLKHNIRHQQAQLHSLENTMLRGPRPLPPGVFTSPPTSPAELGDTPPPPSAFTPPSHSSTSRISRRNSYEVLQTLAGPDSSLPLPRRESRNFGEENGIREGIPVGSPTKRAASPTRTLSRIPVSSVGNARTLAEENSDGGGGGQSLLNASTNSISSAGPASPNRRASFAPGNTTKVLADLQAGVLNAKNALENTKGQLRLSQRQVSQLTRQVEDLKEVRERLRLENEGLNNVVARKERLLQEVLDRARKAEAEVVSLKSQLKSETTSSKKSIREMEASLTDASARTQKSEREYVALRDSMKGLVDGFKADAAALREEMRKREEKVKAEAQAAAAKYAKLAEQVKKDQAAGGSTEVRKLLAEHRTVLKEIEAGFQTELERLKEGVDKSGKDSEQASKTANHLADELSRLRRMMRANVQNSVSSIPVSVIRTATTPPDAASPSTAPS
ncbi:hypothetical protein BXZ70DRAFT_888773 [Cristinia sonorae]|uniref:SWI5-dependent HO expression protein 3 n=1 Tax=Cristinia sonorae TaxID=1940300 RepID=A0A8K0UW43_9AGAR|nr:hypothetical protein BXZ70DRAFT_888773 [Cristinia sonorae]